MSFLTFYVLFEEDVWILVIPMALDDVFMFFNCIALALFAIDLICSSIAIWGYFFGFYFWLDLIAVISLITDITWIWYWVIGVSTDLSKYVDSNGNFDPRQLEGWSSDSQRAEQALLIIRKIRLVRVVKLYKYAVQAFGKSDTKKAEKSMIGKKLSDVTTKRLIILILILVFSIPILDRSTYSDPDPSYSFALQMLSNVPYPS